MEAHHAGTLTPAPGGSFLWELTFSWKLKLKPLTLTLTSSVFSLFFLLLLGKPLSKTICRRQIHVRWEVRDYIGFRDLPTSCFDFCCLPGALSCFSVVLRRMWEEDQLKCSLMIISYTVNTSLSFKEYRLVYSYLIKLMRASHSPYVLLWENQDNRMVWKPKLIFIFGNKLFFIKFNFY